MTDDDRLRVFQLGMHWPSHATGGADRYFHGLTAELTRLGVPLLAAAFGDPVPAPPERRFLGPSSAPLFERSAAVRRALSAARRELPPTVIATHFAGYALPILDSLARAPHIVHFHGPWAEEALAEGQTGLRPLAKRTIERLVYASADRFIVLSAAFKELLITRYRVAESRVHVVPGGLDLEPFSAWPSRAAARAHLGWPGERRILLCVRRLARRMGLDVLLDAVARAAPRFPDLLVFIAGRGAMAAELAARIEQLNLSKHVRLLGFVPDADLAAAYAAADYSILPSQSLEGFGLAAIESLAAGTPTLVTPVGGLPEAVGGLATRLVLAGTTAEAIAEGLATALDHPEIFPTPGACRAHARQFAWEHVAPKIRAHYREVLDA